MNDDTDDESREWLAARRCDFTLLKDKLAEDRKLDAIDQRLDGLLELLNS